MLECMFKVKDKSNRITIQILFRILSYTLTVKEDLINKANLGYIMN